MVEYEPLKRHFNIEIKNIFHKNTNILIKISACIAPSCYTSRNFGTRAFAHYINDYF